MSNTVKIVVNSLFRDLYDKTKKFYEGLPYEQIMVPGENHLYSLDFLKLVILDKKYSDIDYMVYIDEDCIIVDTGALPELIQYTIENQIDCVGMPDGGVVAIRSHNPISINQFFCILNLKKIREKYEADEIMTTVHSSDLEKYTPTDLMRFNYTYDDFEPYYKLFLWMRKKSFSFLYLDAYQYDGDGTTTVLKNHEGKDFAYHTWYGRNWNDPFHRTRIQSVIDHCLKIKNCQ